jgi:transposase
MKGELGMRFIGLDVHRDFCVIAISENGQVRIAGKVKTTPEELEILAQSLRTDDQVALEATSNALAIARILHPRAARVVVATRRDLEAIARAKNKTDRLDAKILARLLAAGLLAGSWLPDDTTRAQRRRLSRRAQLIRSRTRSKNEIHAVLIRNLKGKPPMSDLFGKSGRAWLAELELPVDERDAINAGLRQVDFLTTEIEALDRAIAIEASQSADVRRLMTVPGVSVITAATFTSAIGNIRRFRTPGHLVGYLGLDPKVRQSGSDPGHHGRISKQGPSAVRHTLTEAANVAVRTPGPLRGFYERVRARRGHQIATVAVARKLAVLFWHLLTRDEDYAFTQPMLTQKKIRRMELTAGAPSRKGHRNPNPTGLALAARREHERAICAQAETAYRRLVTDWQRTGTRTATTT